MRHSLPILGLGLLLGCCVTGIASAQQSGPYPGSPPPPGYPPPPGAYGGYTGGPLGAPPTYLSDQGGPVGAPASQAPDPANCGTPDEPAPCPPLPKVPLQYYPANRS